jgi:curved DNA-binding protein CbpA
MPENWEVQWKDYYQILQVHPEAEQEVVKAAYDRLARKYHPDINPDTKANERMKAINEAYEILGDPVKRVRYDLVWHNRIDRRSRQKTQNINVYIPAYLGVAIVVIGLFALGFLLFNRFHNSIQNLVTVPTTTEATINSILDVKIESVTLPDNAHVSSGDLLYNTTFRVVNKGSSDIRVYWEADSSMIGKFDSGYISVLSDDVRDVTKSYSYTEPGVEKVTYSLYNGTTLLDSITATHTISP